MILRLILLFSFVYICSGHNGYNKTTPYAVIQNSDIKSSQKMISDKLNELICIEKFPIFDHPKTRTTFEMLTTIDNEGKLIPLKLRKWVKINTAITYIYEKNTNENKLGIRFNRKKLVSLKNQPFNVLYVRCKLSNSHGTSISAPASFYIDKLEIDEFINCKESTIKKVPFYYGKSFYIECKADNCDLTNVVDVKWEIFDKIKYKTFEDFKETNPIINTVQIIAKTGFLYMQTNQGELLSKFIKNGNVIRCFSKRNKAEIKFEFRGRVETNTNLKNQMYPVDVKQDKYTTRFIIQDGTHILKYFRICVHPVEVRTQGTVNNRWAFARVCKNSESLGCAIITRSGIIFRGSKIYFDYVDTNDFHIVDISKDGGIKFAYFCKNKEQFDVDIHLERDPIFFDYKNSTLNNIDLYVNQSMHKDIYKATVLLNTNKDPVNSRWYVNGKDERRDKYIANYSKYFKKSEYHHDVSMKNNKSFVINFGAEGLYSSLSNQFSVNFYNPIEITYISKSRNYTKPEMNLGVSITIRCEVEFDDRMNIRVVWKHFSTNNRNEKISNSYKQEKICSGGESCVYNYTFQILPHGDADGEYRCIAESLIPSLRHIVAAQSVFLITPDLDSKTIVHVIPASNNWWIFVLIALILLVLIFVLCCCICLQRNQGQEYSVDEKERKDGNDPERELLDSFFQDYQRPEEEHVKGSRGSLSTSMKLGSEGGSSLAEYGDIDAQKFNEDGSFLNVYNDDKKNHTNV